MIKMWKVIALILMASVCIGVSLAIGHQNEGRHGLGEKPTVAIETPRKVLGATRLRQPEACKALTVSSDGAVVASGGGEHTPWSRKNGFRIYLWSAETGRLATTLPGHDDIITGLVAHPSKKILFSCGLDGYVKVWDLNTNKEAKSFSTNGDSIYCMALASNGNTLAAGTQKGYFYLWDLDSGKCIWKCLTNTDGRLVRSILLAPDSAVVCGGDTGAITVWSIDTKSKLREFQAHQNKVTQLAVSPDGVIASSSIDRTIKIWDAKVSNELSRFETTTDIYNLLFLRDGKTLIAGGELDDKGFAIACWDWKSTKQLQLLKGHTGTVRQFALARDGIMLSGGDDKVLVRWDTKTWKEKDVASGHRGSVTSLSISADGNSLVSGGSDNTVRVWNLSDGVESSISHYPGAVKTVSISDKGKLSGIVSAQNRGEKPFLFVGGLNKKEEFRLPITGRPTPATSWSPDCNCLYYVDDDRVLHRWNSESGKEEYTVELMPCKQPVRPFRLVVAPDGLHLGVLFFGKEAPAIILDTRARKMIQTINPPEEGQWMDLAFLDDCSIICASDTGHVIETTTGTPAIAHEHSNLGRGSPFRALAIGRDGRRIVTASLDGDIAVWDAYTGSKITSYSTSQEINLVEAGPQRMGFATAGGADALVYLWNYYSPTEKKPITQDELTAAWEQLSSQQPDLYASGISMFHSAGRDGVDFLDKHLTPASKLNLKTVDRLIEELNDDDFKRREQAMQSLKSLGHICIPQLRLWLLKSSPEAKRRIIEILDFVVPFSPDDLRALRGIDLLEYDQSTSAFRVLTKLAGGASESRITLDARRSISRLDPKKSKPAKVNGE